MGLVYQLPGNDHEQQDFKVATRAAGRFVDWYYTITAPSLSETNLNEADTMLREFDELKEVFSPYSPSALNLPKMHALTKYARAVRENGCLSNYTTEHSERQHKMDVKAPYRASNKVNYVQQIVDSINRRQAFEEMRRRIRGNDPEGEETLARQSERREPVKRVPEDEKDGPRVAFSGRVEARMMRLDSDQLRERLGMPSFEYALRMFLYEGLTKLPRA